jgi:hypothetical protein
MVEQTYNNHAPADIPQRRGCKPLKIGVNRNESEFHRGEDL